MKFVAKLNYTLGIEPATRRPEVGRDGTTTYVDVEPALEADFTHQVLSRSEIEAAKAQILNNGGPYAFGSIPSRDEGNINPQDAVQEGYSSTAHAGYDVYQNLMTFDTADPRQCRPERREEVEAFLLDHYDYGNIYVRVDNYNLTPPWPSYPVDGEVNVKAIVGFARSGGLLDEAILFESNTANREALVTALLDAQAEEKAERAEQAAMSAQV